ncbi:hypothetical protein MN608_11491 [Microdochium nivale]|nr:hypothetical protein MN608_11491 [Microdochium nivale]
MFRAVDPKLSCTRQLLKSDDPRVKHSPFNGPADTALAFHSLKYAAGRAPSTFVAWRVHIGGYFSLCQAASSALAEWSAARGSADLVPDALRALSEAVVPPLEPVRSIYQQLIRDSTDCTEQMRAYLGLEIYLRNLRNFCLLVIELWKVRNGPAPSRSGACLGALDDTLLVSSSASVYGMGGYLSVDIHKAHATAMAPFLQTSQTSNESPATSSRSTLPSPS